MFLVTYRPSTPSLRYTLAITPWYLHFSRHKRLAIGFQAAVGRGSFGQQTVTSKKSFKLRRIFRVLSNTVAGLFVTALVCEYQKDPLRSSMLALVCNSFGCWFYLPQTSNMVYLGYFRVYSPKHTLGFYNQHWPMQVCHFRLHSYVCYIGNSGGSIIGGDRGVRFLRSAGVSGLILSTTFYKLWSLILMPSGAIKVFFGKVYAHGGWISSEASGSIHRNKAGMGINHGVKPRVRGTVKNANDHPNGGRSRSLQCSRTPWGYPAKKSRHPTARSVFKTLEKREKHSGGVAVA